MRKSHFKAASERIEKYLSGLDRAQTVNEIAEGIEMTKSSIYTILQLMEVFGTVQRVKRSYYYYYFLKGVYDEEQISAMLPPEKVKPTPRRLRSHDLKRSEPPVYESFIKEEPVKKISGRSKSKYDLIIDQFIELGNDLVEIDLEGRTPHTVKSQLKRRIDKRGLKIVSFSKRGKVYLERK